MEEAVPLCQLGTVPVAVDLEKLRLTRVIQFLEAGCPSLKNGTHTTLGAHLNTLGAVPLTLPPVPVWVLAGTLR